MADDKEADALELEQAKDDLEARIKEAVEAQERPGEPEEVNVSFDDNPEGGGANAGAPELIERIRAFVDGFERQGVVQKTGVQVRRVTALDSDADGQAAVDVEYDYAV